MAVWIGDAPKNCDMCNAYITNEFYDTRIVHIGSWGSLCPECFLQYGAGLGIGSGQHYQLRPDNKFHCVGGGMEATDKET
jgi:hypothetical protein